MLRLEGELDSLGTLVHSRTNVSKQILVKLSRLENTFEVAKLAISQAQKAFGGRPTTKEADIQTSPHLVMFAETSKPRGCPQIPPGKKRAPDDSPSQESNEGRRQIKKPRRQKAKQPVRIEDGTPCSAKPTERQMKAAKPRQEKPQTQRRISTRPTRPDTLLVKAREGNSYAEILRSLKCDTDLQEISSCVTKVRKNAAGELVLVLDRKAHDRTEELFSAVEKKLADKAEVFSRSDTTTIELKDLDDLTTPDEISQALRSQVEGLEKIDASSVKSLRKAYGGTQIAVLVLPTKLAKAILLKGSLRIGWVVSRAREKEAIRKCYRCLGFGHIARTCRGLDRSKQCFKCGEMDHFAKDCQATDTRCLLCKGELAKGHRTGSYTCPAYQQAVREVNRRR